jgi:hypothetical protein
VAIVSDYYQWLSGKPKKLATALPAAHAGPPANAGPLHAAQSEPEPRARPIEVQEGSASETFIGRVRDFWNRNK